jgi:hypothetical protein
MSEECNDMEALQARAEHALEYLEEHGSLGHWMVRKPAHGWSCDCGDPIDDWPQQEWIGPA